MGRDSLRNRTIRPRRTGTSNAEEESPPADPEIRWIAPRLVEVAPKDFVRSFRNFWVSPRGDTIEIRLGTMSAPAREAPR